MEVRLPINMPGEKKTRWPVIQYERTERKNDTGNASEITKSIRVTDCPLRITIEPWSEKKRVINFESEPAAGRKPAPASYPHYRRFTFDDRELTASVKLRLTDSSASR